MKTQSSDFAHLLQARVAPEEVVGSSEFSHLLGGAYGGKHNRSLPASNDRLGCKGAPDTATAIIPAAADTHLSSEIVR